MKHKAHMNRFTALNTAMSVSFAAFGLFAASAASAENYISISSDAGVQRPNYNNDGATDRFGMAIGVNTKATGHSGIAIGTSTTSAGESATAVGTLSNADGVAATAFGQGAQAVGNVTTAAGQKSPCDCPRCNCFGYWCCSFCNVLDCYRRSIFCVRSVKCCLWLAV